MDTVRLFVGYDQEQHGAGAVFAHSVRRRSSLPVSITEIDVRQIPAFTRAREETQSTEHKYSRFLVPWLCGFEGFAIYADGDMLCRDDIAELWALRDGRRCVSVVQRPEQVTPEPKYLGKKQQLYARKNWSSVMLFNCAACPRLTPEYVSTAPGLELQQFGWLLADADLGDLPREWNHLVGVDEQNIGAKIAHFTLGMPAIHGRNECEFAGEWRSERDDMLNHTPATLAQLNACR
jgi:hypothetical protein